MLPDLVAGAGLELRDLRVMGPTSYLLLYPASNLAGAPCGAPEDKVRFFVALPAELPTA